MRLSFFSLAISLSALLVRANVEKQVFVASSYLDNGSWKEYRDELVNLGIEVLTPSQPRLTREIHAAFPDSPALSEPERVWILLDGLELGRRFELRASFGAMQPCDVNQTVLTISETFTDPSSKKQLEEFLGNRTSSAYDLQKDYSPGSTSQPTLYSIRAVANYFTVDEDLMFEGNIIRFEFTLDPFLLNILPTSLIPTFIYITALVCIAFPLGATIWLGLRNAAGLETESGRSKSSSAPKND